MTHPTSSAPTEQQGQPRPVPPFPGYTGPQPCKRRLLFPTEAKRLETGSEAAGGVRPVVLPGSATSWLCAAIKVG